MSNQVPPPPVPVRLTYGTDPHQFGDLRLPSGKGPFPILMNIHGGYWRAKYDLDHAGPLCEALTAKGLATFNLEYRRVGHEGGGWPGSFEDVAAGYRFLLQLGHRYPLDATRIVVMGHSAGGHLALWLGAQVPEARRVVSLAGVVDLQRAFDQHLSHDAVVDFMGGAPADVPERYQNADPMTRPSSVAQWLIHGLEDDSVSASFSRGYVDLKRTKGEDVHLVEIPRAGHFDLIDPQSPAWAAVEETVFRLAGV